MKPLLPFCCQILFSACAFAQIIPAHRFYDWTKAGFHGVKPDSNALSINIIDLGAANDSSAAADSFIHAAIDSFNGRLGIIYFPAGIYLINSSLALPDSVVLKGASADSTTLVFDLNGAPNDAMDISRDQPEPLVPFVKIISGFEKGSSTLTVTDASAFAAGNYAEIRQDNGSWDAVPASYAEKCMGQMVKIISVAGNALQIEPALRIDFDTLLHAEIRQINPIVNVGIECMKIIRQDSSASPSVYNINFNFAVNCWVNGVESAKSMGAHVLIEYSKNIEITGCYIHHSFGYDGSGTRGYGVCLRQHASDCLVENNVFKFLRHAMMLKEGVNGNVFAYNYSREPNRSEAISDFSGDVSLHGHYAFANLIEGNIVQNIIVDHVWGPSGPHNTFFRNRAELYGMGFTGSGTITSDQNFVANEITNTSPPYGNYLMAGTGQFEYGNNVKGTITPGGATTLADSSYFLASKPAFLDTSGWVSIGIPNTINTGNIPAKERYIDSAQLTVCAFAIDTVPADTIPDSTGTFIQSLQEESMLLHPNPARDLISVWIYSQANKEGEVMLCDLAGKMMLRKKTGLRVGENRFPLELSEIKTPGVYFVKYRGESLIVKKIIIQ